MCTYKYMCVLIRLNMVWPRGNKTVFMLNSAEYIIYLTIVDILTFIRMKNTTFERLKARNFIICWYFSFYEQLKFHAQLS